jgi:hypothetical protein
MIESLQHKEAFEYYYSLGEERSLLKVAPKFTVSTTSLKKWSAAFNWQDRVIQRDIEISKGLEKKTNSTIINEKANYRRIIREAIQSMGDIDVKCAKDLETLVKLDLLLMGESTEKTDNKVSIDNVSLEDKLKMIEKIKNGY